MAPPSARKSNKEEENDLISIDEGLIDKVLGDVGKSSAAIQLLIGTISGWCTGVITVKIGKVAALTFGGGIILLQIANYQGYIKVNWDKVYKQVDKVADIVEEKATGESPKWMEKVERYVDRKLDKAEDILKRRERKARSWYHTFITGEKPYQLNGIHVFLVGFAAGLAIGFASCH
ncbi:hypothetical protein B7P43_G03833 [Cryptotermes secundus]|uniref:FUN14 domain-containing protein 1 n=1 Tax=Cryptotermes secundus TaxID=105785 RepID=A0A2J7QAL0_9NEOP|nr:FUN14 domain-containing protein 1 [Cryptotermes secundus]PNF25611.1 hypothetical protein B7P43_G03833 [Cryptotermes secundus]PNF25612.1 hypothetical protein B7P43_G03833 [Cryptotermes secundus]